MPKSKITGELVIKKFFVIVTSLCTILSFFYAVFSYPQWAGFVARFCAYSFAVFLVIVILLLGIFLYRLEPGLKDGRYLILILSILCSLGSGYLYFKEDSTQSRLGFLFLLAGLSITLIVIVLVLYTWCIRSYASIENNAANGKMPFLVTSITSKLTRLPNNRFEYEVTKYIQSRVPILTVFESRFKWTGDRNESIILSSKTHATGKINYNDDGFDTFKLYFKHPLYYKQSSACHYKLTNLSDNNKVADPFLSVLVSNEDSFSLIRLDVVLSDVDSSYNETAFVQKKNLSNEVPDAKYTTIGTVQFDQVTKSYHLELPSPEPGYDYRILWKKG